MQQRIIDQQLTHAHALSKPQHRTHNTGDHQALPPAPTTSKIATQDLPSDHLTAINADPRILYPQDQMQALLQMLPMWSAITVEDLVTMLDNALIIIIAALETTEETLTARLTTTKIPLHETNSVLTS